MAVKTYLEQLEEVQLAISAIEGDATTGGAQSYTINGRSVDRGDLKTLYAREQWLRKMADRETRGGIRVRGVTVIR